MFNENNKKGNIKVSAKTNFDKNVAIVDSHISLVVCLFSDSSDTWMPNESDRASATAITRMPPITTEVECVLEFKPTINPKVVMIPEVKPKLKPFFIDSLIYFYFTTLPLKPQIDLRGEATMKINIFIVASPLKCKQKVNSFPSIPTHYLTYFLIIL